MVLVVVDSLESFISKGVRIPWYASASGRTQMEETLVGRNYISSTVDKALDGHGVDPLTSPLRELLVNESVIIDAPRSNYVVRARGGDVSLDERIAELKQDPKFAREFPPPPKKVARTEQELYKNFDAIAKGTAVVE
jgi:hypothetical protein